MVKKPSIEELLEKRSSSVMEDDRGPILIKATKAPATFKRGEDGARSARFVMSTEKPDRYRDIVRINGIDTDEFEANPIALWQHRHSAPPLGNWNDVSKIAGRPKRMEGTLDFIPEGNLEASDQVAKCVELGIYRACSIGFGVDDYELIKDDDDNWTGGFDFTATRLFEGSVVAVGANAEALVRAAEIDRQPVIDEIEDILDNWQKTPTGLIVPRDQFEQAYSLVAGEKSMVDGLSAHALNPPADDGDDDEGKLGTLELSIDTEAAEKSLGGISAMLDGLLEKARKLAGITADAAVGSREDDPPEFVEGALERAKALKERVDKQLAA